MQQQRVDTTRGIFVPAAVHNTTGTAAERGDTPETIPSLWQATPMLHTVSQSAPGGFKKRHM